MKLRKREQQSLRNNRRQSIGVMSANRGIGATHLAFAIAAFNASSGKKTAFISRNLGEDIEQLASAIQREPWIGPYLEYERVHCYYYRENQPISCYRKMDYDAFVMDYGTMWREHQEEFLCCTVKIVILDGVMWKRFCLHEQMSELEHLRGKQEWFFLVRNSNPSLLRELHRLYHSSFYAYESMRNPWKPDVPGVCLLHHLINL